MSRRPNAGYSAQVSARAVAVRRLLAVEADGAYVARLGSETTDADTARRASDYVAGVTRLQRRLDFLIGQFYRGDVETLDPPLRQILRLGVYDLVEKGVPPHAAVGEAVGLAREVLHKGAAGLANAVLRAVSRAADALPVPQTGDAVEDLAAWQSHPTWLVRRWAERWGIDATRALLEHDNRVPRYGLRATTGAFGPLLQELESLDIGAERSRWLDDFVTVGRLQPVLRGGLLADGRCAVQDEAAGLVVRVLDPQPGERILDAAAAPGGKAIYAALRMGEGTLVALDVSDAKTRLVAEAAAVQGVGWIETAVGDLRTWGGPADFDAVLLDAPCSGTGVLAKRADLRWRRQPSDLADLAALQDELLDAAARHVRPGGRLVYATCSLEPEENEDRVTAFLTRHPGWRLDPVGSRVRAEMRAPDGTYAVRPDLHQTDGAFAARLLAPRPIAP